jgi:chaperonin cofactor prefoldin
MGAGGSGRVNLSRSDLKSGVLDSNISSVHGGGLMPVKKHGHKHPEVEQRMKALERQMKRLERAMHDLQHKFKTHDHPHSH